jgi:hypothetical protein
MSRKQTKSNNERRQFWQMVIETWQNSGMSVARFCKAEGLSEGAFYNWRKKLSHVASRKNESSQSSPSSFVKVALSDSEHAPIELELSSGNILRICFGADNKTLKSVFSALHEVGLC